MKTFSFSPLHKALSTALLLTTVAGCSVEIDITDEDTDSPERYPNLTISDISANESMVYVANDQLEIDYTLEVEDLDNTDVSIEFHLVHENGQGNPDEEQEQEHDNTYHLASVQLFDLTDGIYQFAINTDIPNVTEGGLYRVLAVVDPADEVAEANEDDNHPNIDNADHLDGDFPAAELEIESVFGHDFLLTAPDVDADVVTLETPEYHSSKGDHHSDIIGHVDLVYLGYSEDAPSVTLTAEVLIEDQYEIVQLWDAQALEHVPAIAIDLDYTDVGSEYSGGEHFIGFDLELTDDQRQAIYEQYEELSDNEISIRLSVVDNSDEDELELDNNAVEITVPLFFFDGGDESDTIDEENANEVTAAGITTTDNTLTLDGSYSAGYGDESKFKVSLDLSGSLVADLVETGATIESGADIDVYVFDTKQSVVAASFDASAYITGANTGYAASVSVFDTMVFSESDNTGSYSKEFSHSWEENRTLASTTFTVGPVPISVEAGIDGSIGYDLTIAYAETLTASGEVIDADLGGNASGGVDLLVASAGVEIEITIVENTLSLDSSAAFSLVNDGELQPNIAYKLKVDDALDAINGKFGLFAEITGIKWCDGWIDYPCGFKTDRYDYWFYETPSLFSKTWTIIDEEGTVPLVSE